MNRLLAGCSCGRKVGWLGVVGKLLNVHYFFSRSPVGTGHALPVASTDQQEMEMTMFDGNRMTSLVLALLASAAMMAFSAAPGAVQAKAAVTAAALR
jgi:hypothetical protein